MTKITLKRMNKNVDNQLTMNSLKDNLETSKIYFNWLNTEINKYFNWITEEKENAKV